MTFLRLFAGILFTLMIFAFFGTSVTSCTKTQTVHDTSYITVRDTTIVKDTVTLVDTLINLSDGLVAYYNFIGGNLNDSSGHGNAITFNNATATTDRFGNPNNAYLFDGSSSYMQVANSASINPNNITLFAIVKVNGFYSGNCHINQILGKGAPTDNINGFYFLRFDDPSLVGSSSCTPTADTAHEFFYGGYGDWNTSQATGSDYDSLFLRQHEWYTIAYTYDGSKSRFFVNGALISTQTNSGTVSFTPNTSDLFIGRNESTIFPYYFNGVIDEVRIYNKAITNQQVEALDILRTKYLRVGKNIVY
ncbi:MAG: LamG domain-containing protein [Bacteroidetes bacterium]|nr:LamG domain-containing protein [Bacteroidota bacterium]